MKMNEFNNKILSFWKKYSSKYQEEFKEMPLLYPELKSEPTVLFIGMNPSSADKALKAYNKEKNTDYVAESFFRYEEDKDIKPIIDYETYVRSEPNGQYYKKLREFVTGDDKFFTYTQQGQIATFEEIDLFYVRKTNQKSIKEFISKNEELKKEMFDLSCKLIKKLNPKVIVCCNSAVRDVFGEYSNNYVDCFNTDKGAYYLNIDGQEFPFFFSSMFSGQRALDIGSYNLLRWNVSNFLKNNLK